MDLIEIGKFIAELRKEKGLTQEQLGEKIGVTNKTVSRWETGAYLPPADALLLLSGEFSVSINEILSGKRLSQEEYKKAAEANLKETIQKSAFSFKEKQEFFKKKWLRDHAAVLCLWGICVAALLILGIVLPETILIAGASALFVLGHGFKNNAMMAYVEKRAFEKEQKDGD